jgi:hypothetical protein
MGVYDQALDAGGEEMIEGVGDQRPVGHWYERLRTARGERLETGAEAGAEDEGGFDHWV